MTPGQAAFEKWVSLLDRPYPVAWRQMSAAERDGWEQVAVAAVEARYAQLRERGSRV